MAPIGVPEKSGSRGIISAVLPWNGACDRNGLCFPHRGMHGLPLPGRHPLEVRGLGILNVNALFGIGAVRPNAKIHLIIHLQEWKQGQIYDRLGLDEETQNILGVEIPKKTIPVHPGRNLASIVEVAAMNYRLHQLGYHSAREFVARHNEFCSTPSEK